MPPPIPEHFKRFTANPTRPARYRPGKAAPEEESSEEDEDEQEQVHQPKQPARKPPTRPATSAKTQAPPLDDDEDDEEGFVTEDEEDELDGGAPVLSSTSKATVHAVPSVHGAVALPSEQHPEHEDDESSEEDEDSEEDSQEEPSSEDETPQRKFQRPTFIKKTDREVKFGSNTESNTNQDTTPAPEISSSHHSEDVTARRLAEAESLIKTTIERDTAARLAGKKSWDDDDDLPPEVLVDDTDGLDTEAEHSAWRLRELHRLKRDRESMVTREKELEEIERRRNLTKEEREAEDREFITRQKEERDAGRGQAAYLSKYHHKGAFFMDDENSERLAKRDLIGAKFTDDVDKSVLPEYMRIRDMTKLGKKGRTRYTDLKGQDTGRFGNDVKRWRGSGYNDNDGGGAEGIRGVDDRFLPDDDRNRRNGGPTASGANASAVGPRKERRRSRSHSMDDRDRRKDTKQGDSYRPRSRSRDRRKRSYSSSRSRSPRRSRSRSPPYRSKGRASSSPHHARDKRRRIEP